MSARPSLARVVPQVRRVLRHFGPHIRQQHPLIAGSLLALLAEVALRLLEPWPLKIVFDGVLGAHRGTGTPGFLRGLEPAALISVCVTAVVVLAGLRALVAYATSVGFALIGNRVLSDLRQALYLHLQRLSLSFHARSGSGELVVRIIGDVGLLKDVAVTALLPLAGNAFVLAGMAAVMLWLDWRLGLLALAVLPIFWISTLRLGRQIHDLARRQRRREGALAARAVESMGGVNTVKALGLEGTFGALFAKESARSLKEGVKAKRLEAGLERSADVLTGVATALVLGYGTVLALRRQISPGDLLVFLSYMKSAFRPLRDFAKYAGRVARAAAAGERVVDLLERTPDVVDRPGAVAAPDLRGAVRFERVTFAYERDQPVLREVDFEVAPGQRVAVVGPSGSGKSTLAGLILRLHDPVSGRVRVDGRDIRDYTVASLRAQVAVLLQDALLFATSVRDNIAYGAPNASGGEIEAAARLAGAHGFIERLPEGYETVVGERGVTLSAGQRQRIAVARAVLSRAPIVILDEPTTGLDVENERAVLQALDRLTADRTTFVITHDLALAATADVVIRLEGGRAAAVAAPAGGRDERRVLAWRGGDALSG